VSAAGFQLKGGGWYATDFKNSGTKSKKEPEKSSDSSKSSDSTKTDASCGTGACPACS
jgi:predicted nucleic acid-binding Zn ribbon protein